MARVGGESRRVVRRVSAGPGRHRGPADPVGARRPQPDPAGDRPHRLRQRLARTLPSSAHLVPQPLGRRARPRAGTGRRGDRRAVCELDRPRRRAGRGRRGAARTVGAAGRRRTLRRAGAGPPGALARGARDRAMAEGSGRRPGRAGGPVARWRSGGHTRLRRRLGPRPRPRHADRLGAVAGRRGVRLLP